MCASSLCDPSSLEVPPFLLWSLDSTLLWLYIHYERDYFPVSLAKEIGGSSTSICPLHRMDGFLQEDILYLRIRDSAVMRLSQVSGTRPETNVLS